MSNTKTEVSTKRYLRQLNAHLADLPTQNRRVIVQDISEHIEESCAAGRTVEETITALGEPKVVAQASREELGLPAPLAVGPRSVGNTLIGAAVALAVFTAVIVSFFLRNAEGQHPESTSTTERTLSSMVDLYGPGVAVLTLLPAVMIALVLLTSLRIRRWATLASAAVMIFVVFYNPWDAGLYFVPVMVVMWFAVYLSFTKEIQAGKAESIVGRILGAVLVIIPVLVFAGALFNEDIGSQIIPALIWMVACLVIVTGILLNRRLAYWAVTAYGALVLVVAAFDAGMLLAALWLGGGLYVAFGLYGLLRLRSTKSLVR